MLLYLPNEDGYKIFTGYIHRNELTGFIHGVGLPIATIGLFVTLYTLLSYISKNQKYIARYIMWFILGGYTSGYMAYDPAMGLITVIIYGLIINVTLRKMDKIYSENPEHSIKKKRLIMLGLGLFMLPILFMEFFSHWYLEGAGSTLSHFPNSVFHTPKYGTEAVFRYIKIF